jgi:radical SAM superfamily enzyme YgiQ (UPF0313 family)
MPTPSRDGATRSALKVLLVSTYDLGHQPFGLASPAAWLRQAGMAVRCADLAVEDLPEGALATADLVAFFVPMHTATRLAVPLISRVKKRHPQAHICCYGLYAPPNADYLRRLGVGTILGGEFEAGLVRLCKRLQQGDPQRQVEPLISLERQDFLVPDRQDLPDLSQYAQLQNGTGSPVTVGYVEASRGCKHHCRHCPVVPVYGGKFRIVQQAVVLEDIRQQVAAGARHITFGDPDFFNGIGHAIPLVEAVHRAYPGLTYDVTIKVEHLLKQVKHLPALRQTGCALITSAVESMDDRVLALLNKGHTREDFIQVVQLCRDEGLVLNPTFVPFTPWTRLEDYLDLLGLLRDLDLVDQMAPIQLAIRLLIPEGSSLLDLPQVRALMGRFEPERLGYVWAHPDPRMDQLCHEITARVRKGESEGASRRAIFSAIWAGAHQTLDEAGPIPKLSFVRPSATIPFLTEPWYC